MQLRTFANFLLFAVMSVALLFSSPARAETSNVLLKKARTFMNEAGSSLDRALELSINGLTFDLVSISDLLQETVRSPNAHALGASQKLIQLFLERLEQQKRTLPYSHPRLRAQDFNFIERELSETLQALKSYPLMPDTRLSAGIWSLLSLIHPPELAPRFIELSHSPLTLLSDLPPSKERALFTLALLKRAQKTENLRAILAEMKRVPLAVPQYLDRALQSAACEARLKTTQSRSDS